MVILIGLKGKIYGLRKLRTHELICPLNLLRVGGFRHVFRQNIAFASNPNVDCGKQVNAQKQGGTEAADDDDGKWFLRAARSAPRLIRLDL